MRKQYISEIFHRVLVPVVYGCDTCHVLGFTHMITGESDIIVAGFVSLTPDESLSGGALAARELRVQIRNDMKKSSSRVRARVDVSHSPWEDLLKVVAEENPDLLILNYPQLLESFKVTSVEALATPPCDMAILFGELTRAPKRILVPIRGGPYSELALRLSLAFARCINSEVICLHMVQDGTGSRKDAAFRGIQKILAGLDEVNHVVIPTDKPEELIIEHARFCDLVILGATAQSELSEYSAGLIADRLLQENPSGLIVVKTQRPMPVDLENEAVGHTAISILVDKWFAENTYHAREFNDPEALYEQKERQNLKISLALPALDEEETVGNVIRTLKEPLCDNVPLLDEIILMDSNSTDRTRDIAADFGIPVFIHQQVLPRYGAREGKGEALWKSLYLTHGDIIIWIDTDITNISHNFVQGLLGPLLFRPDIQFVKGFYRRPLKVNGKIQAGGGGRVTELTARPLLNLFYPELSGVVQPLSGEYGGRRSALERLSFYSGYGVEIGLLIGILENFGLKAIAQVDLKERIHRNQSLDALSKMSFAIIQTVIHKLEGRFDLGLLEEVNKTMKMIRYEPRRLFLEIEEITEEERPPMIEIPEYLEKQKMIYT